MAKIFYCSSMIIIQTDELGQAGKSFCPNCRCWYEWDAERDWTMDNGGCRDCRLPEEEPEEVESA